MPQIDGLRAAKQIVQETNCRVLFVESASSPLEERKGLLHGLREEISNCDLLILPSDKEKILETVLGLREPEKRQSKSRDFKALESDGQLLKGINAVAFGWNEEAAANTALRIEPRRGDNLEIYLRKDDFESVPYPDRADFVKAIGKAWCDNTGEDWHWLLPSVYMKDIRTGEELASHSCVFE